MDPSAAICPRCKTPVLQETSCPTCGAPLDVAPTVRRAPTAGAGSLPTRPQPDRAGVDSPQLGVLPGRRFGAYEVVKPIARGGMGVVFLARDTKLERPVALKVLLAGDLAAAEEVKRFQREALAAGRLRHPNIVPIYDVGEQDRWYYLAMELVDGKPLSLLLRERRPSPDEAAAIVADVADGIAHAHRNGVIHRDLKPANVLIDSEGNVRVTDFGLAKMAKGAELTESGTTLGTPNYMPPEQARGHLEEIDERSDVYSMGAILYDLLTGRPPFTADTAMDTLLQVIQAAPSPPRTLDARVPADLEAICLKALAKDKAGRYASAKEFGDALRGFLSRSAVPSAPTLRVRRRRRRRSRAWIAVLCTVLVVAGVVAVEMLPDRHKQPAAPPVEAEGGRWELRHRETFGPSWPKDWEVKGSWTVTEGGLEGDGDGSIALGDAIPGSAAVEVDLALDHDRAGTLEIRFDSGRDASCSVAVLPDDAEKSSHGIEEPDPRMCVVVRPGPVHSLRIDCTPLSLAEWLDGSATARTRPRSATSSSPIRVSILLSKGRARLRQIRVSGPSPFYLASPFRVAEWLQGKRLWGPARTTYQDFLSAHPTGSLSDEARLASRECASREAEAAAPTAGEPMPGLLPSDPLSRLLRARLASPPSNEERAWGLYNDLLSRFSRREFAAVVRDSDDLIRALPSQLFGPGVRGPSPQELQGLLKGASYTDDLDAALGAHPLIQGELLAEKAKCWWPVQTHAILLATKALAYQGEFGAARRYIDAGLHQGEAGSEYRMRISLLSCQVLRLEGKWKEALAALEPVLGMQGWAGLEAEVLGSETLLLSGDAAGAATSAEHARTRYAGLPGSARLTLLQAIARMVAMDRAGAEKAWEQVPRGGDSSAPGALWKGVGEWIAGDSDAAKRDLTAARDAAIGKEPPRELAEYLLPYLR